MFYSDTTSLTHNQPSSIICSVSTAESTFNHWKTTRESVSEMSTKHVSAITELIRYVALRVLLGYFLIAFMYRYHKQGHSKRGLR